MVSNETAIANLVYRYAEYIDDGDFAGAAALFRNARIYMGAERGEIGHEEVLALWRKSIVIHPGGTPRTRHLISNPIIEVDEAAGTGSCRTYYTVMQQAGDGPLQAVACGRYHDRFARVDGEWCFSHRDYSLHDLTGDMSRHSYNRAEHQVTDPAIRFASDTSKEKGHDHGREDRRQR
ncbi:MAG: nuclear transport factor 2 family protein [Novosphingobium sp.]|jgi:3-phenylpropionate/cinnamic acid dioxygenase small subunit|nr:nuclear transport factor 2 family protein [Novosphingobium sp.]